jgi:microcystin-dependent protein
MSSKDYCDYFYPIPVGTVLPFAGVKVPRDWLLCDGSIFDPTEYPELASVLGENNGHWSLPSLLGGLAMVGDVEPRLLVGEGADGIASYTLEASNIPPLSFALQSGTISGSLSQSGKTNSSTVKNTAGTSQNSVENTGSNMINAITGNISGATDIQFVNNAQTEVEDVVADAGNPIIARSLALTYIIKARTAKL